MKCVYYRWTVKADTLSGILSNYESLMILWDEILDTNPDAEIRARVMGVKAQMEKFEFVYGKIIGNNQN